MRFQKFLLAAAAAVVLATGSAQAGEVLITGSGTYSASADSTTVSAPNETWSFSLTLDNPILTTPPATTGSTTLFDSFSFYLDGVLVSDGTAATDPLTLVQFWPADEGGGFDLDFNDVTFSIYSSNDFGSGGTIGSPSGPWDVAADINNDFVGGFVGQGSGTVSVADVVTTGPGGGVPEPGSWALMIVGIGFAGAMLRRRASASA